MNRSIRKVRGATIFELLVAMTIFLVVSTAVVVLMQNAKTVTVWGDKKNEALRSNREIMRRISYLLRAAVARPAFGADPAQNPIVSCTTTARDTDPANPPYSAGHVEAVNFWCTSEVGRERVQNPAYPPPTYPNLGSFDPRTLNMSVLDSISYMRLSWSVDTGNLDLELRDPTGVNVLATRPFVINSAGRNVIRTLDFNREDAARSVSVYLETRSRDPNTRVGERRYQCYTQIQIPAWQ